MSARDSTYSVQNLSEKDSSDDTTTTSSSGTRLSSVSSRDETPCSEFSLPLNTFLSSHHIQLDACRWCSPAIKYSSDAGSVTILVGIPEAGAKYRAISHVWGETISVNLSCRRCRNITSIAMSSAAKFHFLMKLAGPESTIWLDVFSIDLSNEEETVKTMASMGSIYRNADSVLAVLPHEDENGFHELRKLAHIASMLSSFQQSFEDNVEQSLVQSSSGRPITLGSLAEEFWTSIGAFEETIRQYTYFRRAWTTQEWTAAGEIDVTYEHNHLILSGGSYDTLEGVKSIIQNAADMLIAHKTRYQSQSTIMFGLARGRVMAHYEAVRRLFPHSHIPLQIDVVSGEPEPESLNMAFQKMMSRLGSDDYSQEQVDGKEETGESLKLRIINALDAYRLSSREARFLVDHVNSWASMCDIKTVYGHKDRPAFALQKAVHEIRRRGVRVFNWLVNTRGASAEVDMAFLDYAEPHYHSNLPDGLDLTLAGLPVFTGRSDTLTHFRYSVQALEKRPRLLGAGVGLRKLTGAQIQSVTELTDCATAVHEFTHAVTGSVANTPLLPTATKITGFLRSEARSNLTRRHLIVAHILNRSDDQDSARLYNEVEEHAEEEDMEPSFCAWAVVCWDENWDDLFVAREELNGTLVLACTRNNGKEVHVIAYLTVTDDRTGTYLVPTDENGRISIGMDRRCAFRAMVGLERQATKKLVAF